MLDLLRSGSMLVFEKHPDGQIILKLQGSALVVIVAITAAFLAWVLTR